MKFRIFFLLSPSLFLLCLPCSAFSQKAESECDKVKDGVFYNYPRNSNESFTIIRIGDTQREIDNKSKDTTVYEIKWLNECVYKMKYISGGKAVDKNILELMKHHTVISEITKVTKDYYLYIGHLDKVSNPEIVRDTMWRHDKFIKADNVLFTPITNPSILNKEHFNARSKYAVLYFYRSNRLISILSPFIEYLDDNILCAAKNKSGYMFKILKEGTYILREEVDGNKIELKIDFKFGQKYYVETYALMNMSRFMHPHTSHLELKDAEKGAEGFDKVEFRTPNE